MRSRPRLPFSVRLSPGANTRSCPCPTLMNPMIANGRRCGGASVNVLAQLAGPIALRHLLQRDRLESGCLSGAAELLVALLAHDPGRLPCRLQDLARVEFRRVFGKEPADRRGHREPDAGLDIDLAHAGLAGCLYTHDRHGV